MSWLIAFCDKIDALFRDAEITITFKEATKQAIEDTPSKVLSLVRGAAEDLITAIGQELQRR